jgi:hypothetical protein
LTTSSIYSIIIIEREGTVMAKFLGRIQTVSELIETLKPYFEFDISLDDYEYESSGVCVSWDEEEKTIVLH